MFSAASLYLHVSVLAYADIGVKATTVVISPLIALMDDQVMALKRRGVTAAFLGSAQFNPLIEDQAKKGEFMVLYMTPEKALNWADGFKVRLIIRVASVVLPGCSYGVCSVHSWIVRLAIILVARWKKRTITPFFNVRGKSVITGIIKVNQYSY